MTSGGIGALVGTPAEVALIRQMSDGRFIILFIIIIIIIIIKYY